MKLFTTLAATLLTTTVTVAQTQLVRGDVDRVQNSNTFVLDCTTIELVSTTVNLQQLHDQSRQQDIEYEMQVREVRQGGRFWLDVVSARAIPEIFDMGNLRLGRSDRWSVMGQPNAVFGVYLTGGNMTSYLPAGSWGTWLLGNTFFLLNAGIIPGTGIAQFSFQPPNLPGLVGQTFAAQAAVRAPNGELLITNAQCKDVRAN